MDKSQIIIELTEVFREIFKAPELNLEDNLTANDIDGWNSLSHAMLIDKIEKHFNISFDLEEMMVMHTVNDIKERVVYKILK